MNPRSIRSLVRLSSRPAPFAFELFVDPLLGPGDLEMAGDPSVTLWGRSSGGRDSWQRGNCSVISTGSRKEGAVRSVS